MRSQLADSRLLHSPWTVAFDSLLSSVRDDLLLACPFVTRFATERILKHLNRARVRGSVRLRLITDLRPESSLAGSMDLEAVGELGKEVPGFKLTHLPSLHAKVYVADRRAAIVTSGNLTESGLRGNVEYGLAIADRSTVERIRTDLEGYASLGAEVSVGDVAAFSAEIRDLKKLFREAERSVRREAQRAFKERLASAHTALMRHRAKGKTTHAIFSDTLRFLLSKGPLRTEELHPMVQLLHPDLCDDSIDRVIDGVSFGKKWKHFVRTAQQHLKRRGEIEFDGARWRITVQG